MADYIGHWPTLRNDGVTTADTGTDAARWDDRLANFHRYDMEVAAQYALVGPASTQLPVLPRETRFPRTP